MWRASSPGEDVSPVDWIVVVVAAAAAAAWPAFHRRRLNTIVLHRATCSHKLVMYGTSRSLPQSGAVTQCYGFRLAVDGSPVLFLRYNDIGQVVHNIFSFSSYHIWFRFITVKVRAGCEKRFGLPTIMP